MFEHKEFVYVGSPGLSFPKKEEEYNSPGFWQRRELKKPFDQVVADHLQLTVDCVTPNNPFRVVEQTDANLEALPVDVREAVMKYLKVGGNYPIKIFTHRDQGTRLDQSNE